jgi:hypothetical protein
LMARVLLFTRGRLKPLLVHIYSDDNRDAARETSYTATVQNFKTQSPQLYIDWAKLIAVFYRL